MTTDIGRSGADAPSGSRPTDGAQEVSTADAASIPNAALAGADDWEVGPCVNVLGNVTSWDINVRPREGDRGVAVIASVYSGEVVARAILAAIQTAAIDARRAALTRMVQLDEELGLYDDDASGIETEGQDPQGLGAEHESPTAESGDALRAAAAIARGGK